MTSTGGGSIEAASSQETPVGYIVKEIDGRSYLLSVASVDECELCGAPADYAVLAVAAFWSNEHARAFDDWFTRVLKFAAKGEARTRKAKKGGSGDA